MNTQRLWDYLRAKKALDRAVEVLREFEASVCSPRTPRYDGIPSDGSTSEQSLDAALDHKRELQRTIGDLTRVATEKHAIILGIARMMGGEEEIYCIEVYIRGASIKEVAQKMHISRSTVYRLRRNILSYVEGLPD